MRAIRCSSLPLLFSCAHALDDAPLLIEAYDPGGPADLGTAVHDAMRSVVQGIPVDVELVALRHGVDAKELGPLVAYGRKAWSGGEDQEPLRDAFPLPETEVEVAVEMDDFTLTGHIDLRSIIGPDEARCLDWKSGRKESSDYYAQVAGYATVLIFTHNLERVVATVVWLRSQSVETHVFTRADALAFVDRVRAQLANQRYQHGEHCAYCPRSHDCPALVAIARRDAAILSQSDVDTLVEQAPPEQVVALRRNARVLTAVLESFDKAVRRRIADDGPLPSGDGYELALVEENGKREIDVAKAWPVVQAHLDEMTDEQLNRCVTLSAAGLDEVVAKKAGRGKGAAAKRALAAELEAAGAVTQSKVMKLKEIRQALPAKEDADVE